MIVIAGPNGAGKSTTAPSLLRDALQVTEFVNADTIAGGLSAFRPDSVAIAAGRAMLARIRYLAEAQTDFAFETALASRTFAPWLARLKSDGYHDWSRRATKGARSRSPTHRSGRGSRRYIVSTPERVTHADERVQDATVVEEALAKAVSEALRRHKRAGNPVPEWRDGKVRWLAPEEIPDLAVASGEA